MNTQLGLRSDGGFPRFSSQQTPGRIPSKRPRSRLQEEEDSLWLPPSSCSSSPLSSSSRNSTGYEKGPAPKKLQHTSTTAETGVAQGVYGNLPLTADSLSLGSGGFRDYGAELQMKSDHTHRPLWVCKDGCILLEMFSVASRQANELLLTIAEPICRGDFVHEFQITIFSLYAGISIGLTCDDMLHNLEKFSKNYIPEDLVEQIQKVASAFGKVKLVLNESKYYIESAEKKELDYLLSNPLIRSSAVSHHSPLSQNQLALMTNSGTSISGHLTSNILSTTSSSSPSPRGGGGSLSKGAAPSEVTNESLYVIANAPTLDASQLAFPVTEKEDDHGEKESSGKGDRGEGSGEAKKGTDGEATSGEGDSQKSHQNKKGDRDQAGTGAAAKKAIVPARQVFSFQVSSDRVEEVKRLSVECMHRPLLNEYDFRRDKANKNLSSLLLKPTTKIRYYQERALRKMFSNGRARSGIIVLPCGAGKTLTGITAACTLRKSVMILTTSAVAVDQWRKQFEEYTTIDCSRLLTLTAETKQNLWPLDEAGVLVSTYTMLAFSGRRSAAAERIMQQVKEREWGLLIFDEVQFAPAPAFRRINDLVKYARGSSRSPPPPSFPLSIYIYVVVVVVIVVAGVTRVGNNDHSSQNTSSSSSGTDGKCLRRSRSSNSNYSDSRSSSDG
ncbi:dna repair helicase [Cystoisospora suis]|uniref:Dna repair helicase n=1 Tax=Cystoisospora suis TaxID=483139 RepID=A0A2C6KQC8_9APIC|nr:dna repair helicase [Cystoisospora suis]